MAMTMGRALLVVGAAAAIAGCASSSDPASPGALAESTAVSSSPPNTGAPAGGAISPVTGTLTSVDDVEGGGTAPGSGTLAIVSVDREGELWDAIEVTPDDQALSTVGGLVEPDVVAGMAMVEVVDGAFEADVPDGDHVVCVLGGTGPHLLQGCARTTVDGPSTWELTHGEGGLDLSS